MEETFKKLEERGNNYADQFEEVSPLYYYSLIGGVVLSGTALILTIIDFIFKLGIL